MFSPIQARDRDEARDGFVEARDEAPSARDEAPQPMLEDSGTHLDHVFPHLVSFPREDPSSTALIVASHNDPFTRLEEGQIFESRVAEEPTTLGSIDVGFMPADHVLFVFGILSFMANLKPLFTYKYGPDGKIGVRLSFYGHTMVIEPVALEAHDVCIRACRRGLAKLRKFNPSWVLPPLPMDGPSGPEWDWVQLLVDYGSNRGWPAPRYEGSVQGTQCFCNVFVNGQVFNTTGHFTTAAQARNTAAHIALHRLLNAKDGSGPESILPAGLPVGAPMDIPPVLSAALPLQPSSSFNGMDSLLGVNATAHHAQAEGFTAALENQLQGLIIDKSAKCSKGAARRARRAELRARAELFKNIEAPFQPQKVKKKSKKNRRKHTVEQPEKQATQSGSNANRVPLRFNRLPLVEQPEVAEDKLGLLKDLQAGVSELHATASYWRLLNKFCDVLKIEVPRIRLHRDFCDNRTSTHLLRVWFDGSNPYLARASPVHLAEVNLPEDEEVSKNVKNDAHARGVQKVLVYLLKILREDAEIDLASDEYSEQLPVLWKLEYEIENRLLEVVHSEAENRSLDVAHSEAEIT